VLRKNWFVADLPALTISNCAHSNIVHHEKKVTAFEAHPDYIRCLTVHPTASIVLTGSDDMTLKAWDWEKQWKCVQVCIDRT
jgi:coatomer subunit beta'